MGEEGSTSGYVGVSLVVDERITESGRFITEGRGVNRREGNIWPQVRGNSSEWDFQPVVIWEDNQRIYKTMNQVDMIFNDG